MGSRIVKIDCKMLLKMLKFPGDSKIVDLRYPLRDFYKLEKSIEMVVMSDQFGDDPDSGVIPLAHLISEKDGSVKLFWYK